MIGYATTILAGDHISIPAGVNTPELFLQWANMRFQDNQYKNGNPTWLELANWFNVASGRTPYTGEE
jgi:hypothetical protein